MDSEELDWKGKVNAALGEYADGRIGLDALSEIIVALVGEATSCRGEIYELAYELASRLERQHDLRTSTWNKPEDVGPEDDRDLMEILAAVRGIVQ